MCIFTFKHLCEYLRYIIAKNIVYFLITFRGIEKQISWKVDVRYYPKNYKANIFIFTVVLMAVFGRLSHFFLYQIQIEIPLIRSSWYFHRYYKAMLEYVLHLFHLFATLKLDFCDISTII